MYRHSVITFIHYKMERSIEFLPDTKTSRSTHIFHRPIHRCHCNAIVVSSVTKPGGNGVLRVFNNANSRILTGKAHFSTWTDR